MNRCACLLSSALLVIAGSAHADIYTWVDAHGVRHFSDIAASNHAERADLPGLQSVAGDPDALEKLQAQRAANAASSAAPADSRKPAITQPKDGATIRDTHGTVSVAATIGGSADLRSGEQITYYLDGSPIPKSPSKLTSLKLGGVTRGTHSLSAALLYRGHEIRRTAPLTFYMKPPSAISPLNANQGGGTADTRNPLGAPVATPAGNVSGAPAAPRFNTTTASAGAPPA